MDISIGYVKNTPKVVNKTYTEVKRISNVKLKEETSVLNPTFILLLSDIDKVSDISNINYLHWFQSGRYYFVEDIVFNGTLISISCKCDVLKSFSKDITASKNIVERCQEVSKRSNLIADALMPLYQKKMTSSENATVVSGGFSGSSVVLTTTGSAESEV